MSEGLSEHLNRIVGFHAAKAAAGFAAGDNRAPAGALGRKALTNNLKTFKLLDSSHLSLSLRDQLLNHWFGIYVRDIKKTDKNLENDEETENVTVQDPVRNLPSLPSHSSQCSFSTISNSTQLSHRGCISWTRHPLVQKNKKVVLSSFLLLIVGLALVFVGVGLQVSPSPALSSAIFFVPGFLLLIPGVYHVIFIYCAVRGRRGFQFFYLPYFDK
ncbi:transmembrane protein 134 [Discoglossus pictus]